MQINDHISIIFTFNYKSQGRFIVVKKNSNQRLTIYNSKIMKHNTSLPCIHWVWIFKQKFSVVPKPCNSGKGPFIIWPPDPLTSIRLSWTVEKQEAETWLRKLLSIRYFMLNIQKSSNTLQFHKYIIISVIFCILAYLTIESSTFHRMVLS